MYAYIADNLVLRNQSTCFSLEKTTLLCVFLNCLRFLTEGWSHGLFNIDFGMSIDFVFLS